MAPQNDAATRNFNALGSMPLAIEAALRRATAMRLRALLWAIAIGLAGGWSTAFGAPPEDGTAAKVVTQLGHASSVDSVAFSPDGRLALSGSGDKTVKLWEVASGRLLRTFFGHTGRVGSVAFSFDGKLAISGGLGVKLWDVTSGQELRSFHGSRPAALSPDGRFALAGDGDSNDTLKLWEVGSGREVRSFAGHTNNITSAVFSPDGKFALSGSQDKTLKLWEVGSGRLVSIFSGHTDGILSVAFSPDGKFLLSGSKDQTIRLWEVASGRELRSFTTRPYEVRSVAFSPDGKLAISADHSGTIKLWVLATGRELRSMKGHSWGTSSVAFSPDGKLILSGGDDNDLRLWDADTGLERSSFAQLQHLSSPVTSVVFAPDGALALSASGDSTVKVWDTASGGLLRTFTGHNEWIFSLALSPDGKLALSGSVNSTRLWDVASGRELRNLGDHMGGIRSICFSFDSGLTLTTDRTFMKLWDVASGGLLHEFKTPFPYPFNSVACSPDGKLALSGGYDRTLALWDISSGRELRRFDWKYLEKEQEEGQFSEHVRSVAFSPDGSLALSGTAFSVKLWDVTSGRELRSFKGHTTDVNSVAFSPDGTQAVSGGWDDTVTLWDVATGRELRSFTGHAYQVNSVAFSPDGKKLLSGNEDATVRLWDLQRGEALATSLASRDGEWLTIMPEGFFSSSHRDTNMLAIVRGLEAVTIGQVHQSLFNPDLVREALAGDPDGEVKRSAEVVNLKKVLDAGPPPTVVITSHQPGSRSRKDLVTVAARITDRGKGIGRIEWRINGVTAGVKNAPAGGRRYYDITQELALDPGENRIELIAYEGRNLLASLPAQTTIVYDGPADVAKPKLHILAIGINDYVDDGGEEPGTGRILHFPPLSASVPDAKAFSAEMEKAGAGQYAEVRVTQALDRDATTAKLDETFRKLAGEVSPRDTFVFYAAAHGYTVGGNYYMIPQDYQGGPDPQALKTRAIGQDRIQDWIANRIKAKKAIILLDTCESGVLTGGYTKSRTEGPVSEAAVGRLHEATGRPVLTAASGGKSAYEGYKGHGVFTYALLEALHLGDTNGNGKIEVTELAAHVGKRVPELFAELKANGWAVKGVTAAAARGAGSDAQSAHFGSTGEDFSIVARLP